MLNSIYNQSTVDHWKRHFVRAGCTALVVLLVGGFLTGSRHAAGETLYTVNTLSDTLVAIDSTNGHTTPIGPIGFDMHATDLALVDHTLYAVTSNSDALFNNPGFTLVTINPLTGAMINNVALSIGGNQPHVVESLGVANGNLYIGFSPTGTVSTDVGQLNPNTGVITNDVNYSLIPGVNNFYGSFGVDLDGMTRDATGTGLLTLDTDNSTLISIVRIDPVNVTAAPVSQFILNPGLVDDLVIGLFGTYMIGGGDLYTMDLAATHVVRTVGLSPAGSFSGLAIPEPSSIVHAAIGFIGLGWRWWREVTRGKIT
jgi:hypothetical protein